MRRDLLSIICMTLVCATVMLGVMSIYKFLTPTGASRGRLGRSGFAFEITSLGSENII